MKCPVDDTVLAISDRSGIEIDYCPTCRGVWLDRGELDKIIERSDDDSKPERRGYQADDDDRSRNDRYDTDRSHNDRYDNSPKKKKKSSMFSELFDF